MENKDLSFTIGDLLLIHRALIFTSRVLLMHESCDEYSIASRMFDIVKKVVCLCELVGSSEDSCKKVVDFSLK